MSACLQEPLATNSKQVTGHEFCTPWADKCLYWDFSPCTVHHPPPEFTVSENLPTGGPQLWSYAK